jgi:hypothetical protein
MASIHHTKVPQAPSSNSCCRRWHCLVQACCREILQTLTVQSLDHGWHPIMDTVSVVYETASSEFQKSEEASRCHGDHTRDGVGACRETNTRRKKGKCNRITCGGQCKLRHHHLNESHNVIEAFLGTSQPTHNRMTSNPDYNPAIF